MVILPVAPSVWKGVIKNVPGPLDGENHANEDSRASVIGKDRVVTVSLSALRAPSGLAASSPGPVGPVLVLQGLRYRGNVGTIFRTAVQSNVFRSIVIIAPVHDPTAKNNDRIPDSDLYYYSLMNAPLIDISRMASVSEFLEYARSDSEAHRPFIATSLAPGFLDMFSSEASSALLAAGMDAFVFLGSEGGGLSNEVTGDDRCTYLRIPSMSSSINVGAAFAMLVAAISKRRAEKET